MKKKQEKWRSPSLGKDMTINIYGESGTPVIGLPSRGQNAGQWEEHGLTSAIAYQLDNGFNQLFCVDTVDTESFMNKNVAPHKRLMRHQQYESYLVEEVAPFIKEQNTIDYLMIAGIDLGAYHAVSMALKHPGQFDKVIAMSGLYDIKYFFDDFYNNDLYYNNPVDFIPNLNKESLLQLIRSVDFRLVAYANDPRKYSTVQMNRVLRRKFIDHQFEIWDVNSTEEWRIWKQMLRTHIV